MYHVQLPNTGDMWSNYMDFELRRMDLWEKVIPGFKYSKETPFFEMVVPTVDTVRFGYLLEKLLAVKQSVLYTGNTGVGKVRFLILILIIIVMIITIIMIIVTRWGLDRLANFVNFLNFTLFFSCSLGNLKSFKH